jgi:hypothetical protein
MDKMDPWVLWPHGGIESIGAEKAKKAKSVPVAVILQRVPPLGVVSCSGSAVGYASGLHWPGPIFFLTWFSTLFWGWGYLYLKKWGRAAAASLIDAVILLLVVVFTVVDVCRIVEFEKWSLAHEQAGPLANRPDGSSS